MPVVGEEPADAEPKGIEDLLIHFEREDDVAVGCIALLLVADQIGHEGGGHELVVAGATAIEVAVALREPKRIDRPVLTLRVDHVEVREQQDRPPLARPTQARHQVAFACYGREYCTSCAAKPAVMSWPAIASAARAVSPAVTAVLISTSSL